MARGAMEYFMCFTMYKHDILSCIKTYGPGADEALVLGLLDYLGSCVLVWVAFRFLPQSKKYVKRTYVGRSLSLAEESEDEVDDHEQVSNSSTSCFCCSYGVMIKTKGGRLRHLLKYDVKCFAVSLVVLVMSGVY